MNRTGAGVGMIELREFKISLFFHRYFALFVIYHRRLPVYKQRIAGKSIPFEKFSIHKANKYLEQNNRLFLPGLVIISSLGYAPFSMF